MPGHVVSSLRLLVKSGFLSEEVPIFLNLVVPVLHQLRRAQTRQLVQTHQQLSAKIGRGRVVIFLGAARGSVDTIDQPQFQHIGSGQLERVPRPVRHACGRDTIMVEQLSGEITL